MLEVFFKVRSSSTFEEMWKQFLTNCGTQASATVYQHVTDIVFNEMVSKQFPLETHAQDKVQPEITMEKMH